MESRDRRVSSQRSDLAIRMVQKDKVIKCLLLHTYVYYLRLRRAYMLPILIQVR